jgi:hypothetical protein
MLVVLEIDWFMNTRILMSASAIVMASLGLTGLFLPEELLTRVASSPDVQTIILVQICAAAYLGFAALNWMARGSMIGGIYGRPVTIANLLHFSVAALTLIKANIAALEPIVFALAGVYTIFAVCFGMVLFVQPEGNRSNPV